LARRWAMPAVAHTLMRQQDTWSPCTMSKLQNGVPGQVWRTLRSLCHFGHMSHGNGWNLRGTLFSARRCRLSPNPAAIMYARYVVWEAQSRLQQRPAWRREMLPLRDIQTCLVHTNPRTHARCWGRQIEHRRDLTYAYITLEAQMSTARTNGEWQVLAAACRATV